MKTVFDPEYFSPHIRSWNSSSKSILEHIPHELPQLEEHFLNNGPTEMLVRRALFAYEMVEAIIANKTQVGSGINLPKIETVSVVEARVTRSNETDKSLMLSGIFGFKVDQIVGKPPKLEVFLRADENGATMAQIGYFDLGRPDREEYPFMNVSGTLGYDVALEASRIAMATLYRNATVDLYD